MKTSGSGTGHYLHDCLALHDLMTEVRYGKRQGLRSIEEKAKELGPLGHFATRDLVSICNEHLGDIRQFGVDSSGDGEAVWDFSQLPKGEDGVIERLLQRFRHVEPVSVMLRFVVPRYYGIMSPPVEKVLGNSPARRASDRLKAFLLDLRALRKSRRFETVAEVDMALWVLQLGVLDGGLKGWISDTRYERLRDGFEKDLRLREIRVGNLTRQLFGEFERLELAEALLATNVELAGQIAGIEFERSVKEYLDVAADDRRSLYDLVEQVAKCHPKLRGRLHAARKTRNRAVHGECPPCKKEVEDMIAVTKLVRALPRR